MAAVELEPISPELVLVCPELRERAIAALPDLTWQSFVADVRIRTPARTDPDVSAAAEIAWSLVRFVVLSSPVVVGVVVMTLALTLVADAIR